MFINFVVPLGGDHSGWFRFIHSQWNVAGFEIVTCRHHCVKSVRLRSFSDPCFPVFGLNTGRYSISPYWVWMRENTDQKNPEYGHCSRSAYVGHRQRPKINIFSKLMTWCSFVAEIVSGFSFKQFLLEISIVYIC